MPRRRSRILCFVCRQQVLGGACSHRDARYSSPQRASAPYHPAPPPAVIRASPSVDSCCPTIENPLPGMLIGAAGQVIH